MIHNQFKILIQYLFSFTEVYFNFDQFGNGCTIVEILTSSKKSKFIDLLPYNEEELKILCYCAKKTLDDDQISRCLEGSQLIEYFQPILKQVY